MDALSYNHRQAGGPPGHGSCPGGAVITDTERGEVICGRCGRVLAQGFEDAYGEWGAGGLAHGPHAAHQAGQQQGPAGSPMLHDGGLSTVMGRDVDAGGRPIPADSRRSLGRLRVWNQRSRSKRAASLARALSQLNSMTGRLAVPRQAAENAAHIYRSAVGKGITRGRTVQSMAAASLYAACRRLGIPRTLDDVAKAANVERGVLSRDLRTLIRYLELDLGQYDSASFIVKMANNLGIREKTKRLAIDVLARTDKVHAGTGKNPVSQAAAALYIACVSNSEPVTQRRIAVESGISAVTIRNRAATIKDALAARGGAAAPASP